MRSLFPINLILRWKQQAIETKISSEDFLNRFYLFSMFRGMEQSEGGTEMCMSAHRALSFLLVVGCAAQMLGFDLYCDLYLGNLSDFSGSA